MSDTTEEQRRLKVLDEGNAAYAALRADPVAWSALQEEREVWDSAVYQLEKTVRMQNVTIGKKDETIGTLQETIVLLKRRIAELEQGAPL